MKEEHKMTWRVVNTALVTLLHQILCSQAKGISVSVSGAKKFSFVSLSLSFRSLLVSVSKPVQIIQSSHNSTEA